MKSIQKGQCNHMRVVLPAISVNEAVARAAVAAFCAQCSPTATDLADLKCAVSEAVTNCVVHAYGGKGGVLYINVRSYDDRSIAVEVRDKGRGIEDIKKAMEPLYTTDKSGERSGIGFAVMQSFTDSVKVRSQVGKGTSVTLIKKLSAEE